MCDNVRGRSLVAGTAAGTAAGTQEKGIWMTHHIQYTTYVWALY